MRRSAGRNPESTELPSVLPACRHRFQGAPPPVTGLPSIAGAVRLSELTRGKSNETKKSRLYVLFNVHIYTYTYKKSNSKFLWSLPFMLLLYSYIFIYIFSELLLLIKKTSHFVRSSSSCSLSALELNRWAGPGISATSSPACLC